MLDEATARVFGLATDLTEVFVVSGPRAQSRMDELR